MSQISESRPCCPDCGCLPDIERCSVCGQQRVSCGSCPEHDPAKSRWSPEEYEYELRRYQHFREYYELYEDW
jgi:hypothetical protein